MKSVLIISNSLDIHSDIVEKAIKTSEIDVVRINTDKFSSDGVELILDNSFLKKSGVFFNERWYSFGNVLSIWYRRPGSLETIIENVFQKDFAEKELEELLRQIYFLPFDIVHVSSQKALDFSRRKFPQLKIAEKFGLKVPKTIMTNSVFEVKKFFKECNEEIVYKTLKNPVIKPAEGPELWGVPTTLITHQQMEQIDLIRKSGGIFQEYIDKKYEVRVTIIGNDVFSAKIDSQADVFGKIDWRDAVAKGIVRVEPYNLPDIIARQCKSIVTAYGLNFGAIDLIYTPEKEYIFLEINCNGQWLWVEELTNQRLVDSMVGLLTKKRPSLV